MKNWFWIGVLAVLFVGCGPEAKDTTDSVELENRQALVELYGPLTGIYRGEVQPISRSQDPFPVELKLNVVDERTGAKGANGQDIYRPILVGTYVRKDLDAEMIPIIRRPLSARFYKETKELVLQNSDNPSAANVAQPQMFVVYITARVQGSRIVGQISNGYGLIGTIDVVRE